MNKLIFEKGDDVGLGELKTAKVIVLTWQTS